MVTPISQNAGERALPLHHLQLAHLATRRIELTFASFARFLKVLMFFNVGHQTCFFASLGKTLQSSFKGFVFTNANSWHSEINLLPDRIFCTIEKFKEKPPQKQGIFPAGLGPPSKESKAPRFFIALFTILMYPILGGSAAADWW